jgi:OTU domain-containing protein 3
MPYEDEFPLLAIEGLYASEIRGDGNCLFNALSDQVFGDQKHHREIREAVVKHMKENKDEYVNFIAVFPGGATRRNERRRCAKTSASDLAAPTQADIDRQWGVYLKEMNEGGTYGGDMEILAFSRTYTHHVKIYTESVAYVITAHDSSDTSISTAHIAYHEWQHYSSIRNIDGPHYGLPNVSPIIPTTELIEAEKEKQRERAARAPEIKEWMIKVVKSSLPHLVDDAHIIKTLQETKGDVNIAVDRLLESRSESPASDSSQHSSGSSKRVHDSDDDDNSVTVVNKRQKSADGSPAPGIPSASASHPRLGRSHTIYDSEDEEPASTQESTPSLSPSRASTPAAPTTRPTQRLTLKLTQTRESRSPIRKTKARQVGPQSRKAARKEKKMTKKIAVAGVAIKASPELETGLGLQVLYI